MGQVVLSLEEYDQLKKETNIAAQVRDCFSLEKTYGGEIKLSISVGKAAEIFKAMFEESIYNNGTYEIQVDKDLDYTTDVAGYYVKAVKKKEEPEEAEAQEEKGEESEGGLF